MSEPTREQGELSPLEKAKAAFLKDNVNEVRQIFSERGEQNEQVIRFILEQLVDRLLAQAKSGGLAEGEQQQFLESIPEIDHNVFVKGGGRLLMNFKLEGVDPKMLEVVTREFTRAEALARLASSGGGVRGDSFPSKSDLILMYRATLDQNIDSSNLPFGFNKNGRLDIEVSQALFDEASFRGYSEILDEKDPTFFADMLIAMAMSSEGADLSGNTPVERIKMLADQKYSFIGGCKIDTESGLPYRAGHKEGDLAAMKKSLEVFGKVGEIKYETPAEVAEKRARLETEAVRLNRSLEEALDRGVRDQQEIEAQRTKIKGLDESRVQGWNATNKEYARADGVEKLLSKLQQRDREITEALTAALAKPGLMGGNLKEVAAQVLEKLNGKAE